MKTFIFKQSTTNQQITNVLDFLDEHFYENIDYELFVERGDDLPTVISVTERIWNLDYFGYLVSSLILKRLINSTGDKSYNQLKG